MATKKQIAANRRNAAKSTGPRSAAGKARSSKNALRHGLTAQALVVPGENAADFESLLEAFRTSLQPADAVEEALVFQIAAGQWRLQRYLRTETGLLTDCMGQSAEYYQKWGYGPFPPASAEEVTTLQLGSALKRLTGETDRLTSIARYEAAIRRQFFQALQMFEARRQLRLSQAEFEPEPVPIEPEEPELALIEAPPVALPEPREANAPENYETNPVSRNDIKNQKDSNDPGGRPKTVDPESERAA